MAKRKQGRARKQTRKTARGSRKAAGKRPATAKRSAARTRTSASGSRNSGRKGRKAAAKGRAGSKGAAAARRSAPGSGKPGRTSTKAAPKAAAPRTRKARPAAPGKVLKRESAQHRLQIERARRVLPEAIPGPPSSLDLDRHASAARTGRAEMQEHLTEHTESSPRLTGGDVDANWASAFSTGDEAPGGDMPTPDQDIVEEIGSSLGVQYADDEELKAVDKIEQRDRHRWELDPASSEDYKDRTKK